MKEEQPKRKSRIPLSNEELFYIKEIKKLNELKYLEEFKATKFYNFFNRANIVLSGFLSYCILSILICNYWEESQILKVQCSYGEYSPRIKKRTIDEIEIISKSANLITIKTNQLFKQPTENEVCYIGRDFLFKKIIKVKLAFDERNFWQINTYPVFIVTIFSLTLGFFVYKINKHLSINGLLTVFGVFTLSSLYYILV